MRPLFLTILLAAVITTSFGNTENAKKSRNRVLPTDTIHSGLYYIKQLTSGRARWHFENEELEKTINGLIHHIEDEKIDTILVKLDRYKVDPGKKFLVRKPENVSDTLEIKGFIAHSEITEKMKQFDRSFRSQLTPGSIPVPEQILTGLDKKVKLVPKENTQVLIRKKMVVLPDSLKALSAIKDTLSLSKKEYQRYHRLDSVKKRLLEKARIDYNERLLQHYIDSVTTAYREMVIAHVSDSLQRQLKDSLLQQNWSRVISYNDSVTNTVNDSLRKILTIMENYARNDSVDVWIYNSGNDATRVWLRNNDPYSSRVYIKNEQNDSLGIRVQNLSKNSMKLIIDDAVSFNRMREQNKRDIKFEQLPLNNNLGKVEKMFEVITPWNLGSSTNFGFTQTSLSNWKKGGKSSLSVLAVLKGYANYSNVKVKWENSIELRNGWTRLSESDGPNLQKNDDKFEVISRLGLSAFKKWYYSTEVDFETQFFNGYNYPDKSAPISGFMAPARTLIKIGLDYKPSKNFSLFISPLTSKTIFVRDTAAIDQTKYGVAKDKRRFWEPGLNTDISYKKAIFTDVMWETKYKMFINYREPFEKLDINWENIVSMRLNDYINVNFMLHMIYDSNVTFLTDKIDPITNLPVYEPKWQVKELITIGFVYSLNRKIYKRQQVKQNLNPVRK